MANQVRLEAVLEAKDNASDKIKKFDLSIGKLAAGVGLGTLAANAFTKATGFVTDAIKDSIQAARDEEVATAKVNAIVQTLSGNLDEHRKTIEGASQAAMKLGFDDEDAAISMAKLLQVTGDATQAQSAMSNAMDLARFKGMDLESATQAINMALQGNTRVLKQLGIDIPENATKMELLGLIHDKVKGQAEGFGNTASGAQEKLAVAMENVKEKFGGALAKGLTPFVNKLTDWISKPETMAFLEKFATVLGKALELMLQLAEKAAPFLVEAGKAIQKTWTGVTDTLANVIYFFMQLVDKIKEIKNLVTEKVSGIGESIGNFFKNLNPFKATGGFVSTGMPQIVGERGPELFVPTSSGRVVPNDKMGGGSVTVNFNNPIVRSESDMQRLVNEVQRALAEGRRLVDIGAV